MMLSPDFKYFGADPPGEKQIDPGKAAAFYNNAIDDDLSNGCAKEEAGFQFYPFVLSGQFEPRKVVGKLSVTMAGGILTMCKDI